MLTIIKSRQIIHLPVLQSGRNHRRARKAAILTIMAQALLLFRRGCIARREEVAESSGIVTADGRHCGYYAKSGRSEEHTYELPSLIRITYDVFCLNNKKT